ncbi:zinc finger and SCAN domain-containing protein 5B-like [Ochotona princeps]|uniref:zinc finger and SCAN domain-containing protein 5B-like n=1 Tax=Ochotona princeps TaxID=9978 RepID=UPI002714D020|nr:zinc finger and SCAN domain-containing protein 5B-like [Ochotona princeps]
MQDVQVLQPKDLRGAQPKAKMAKSLSRLPRRVKVQPLTLLSSDLPAPGVQALNISQAKKWLSRRTALQQKRVFRKSLGGFCLCSPWSLVSLSIAKRRGIATGGDAQPELQDGSPEEWHVRFRTLNGWEDADPIRDLRMLRELCRRWLRPELHTKEQFMDQLVLEHFLISMPPDVQVLVKESGVTSCRDLEELLRNSWRKPTSYMKPQAANKVAFAGAMQLIKTGESKNLHMAGQLHRWLQQLGQQGQTRSRGLELRLGFSTKRAEATGLVWFGATGSATEAPWGMATEAPADSGEDASEGVIACSSGADPPPIPALEAEASPRSGSHRRRHAKKRRVHPEGSGEHPQAENSRFPAEACLPGAHPHPTEPAPRRYQCGDCSKSFCYRSQLVIHQRSHTGERPFQCEDGSKGFMQPSDLLVHQRIHTGEKPFVCTDCGHAFSHEANLVTHRRVHTQERPYMCKYCGQSVSQRGNLNVHYRIHTNTKPYCCEVCGQCFTHVRTFKRHLKIHERAMPPK